MYCKKCGNLMDENATVCPVCGERVKQKKPVYKKWWFWVLMGLATVVTIVAVSGSGEDVSADEQPSTDVQASQSVDDAETDKDQPTDVVEYEVVDLKTMINDLKENALRAEKSYQDKNVEVTGVIRNFDSDGSYISIEPTNADMFSLISVMCYIKNDDQLNYLLEKSVGDTVTVKGKITSIGEILGYSINIAEVY